MDTAILNKLGMTQDEIDEIIRVTESETEDDGLTGEVYFNHNNQEAHIAAMHHHKLHQTQA